MFCQQRNHEPFLADREFGFSGKTGIPGLLKYRHCNAPYFTFQVADLLSEPAVFCRSIGPHFSVRVDHSLDDGQGFSYPHLGRNEGMQQREQRFLFFEEAVEQFKQREVSADIVQLLF